MVKEKVKFLILFFIMLVILPIKVGAKSSINLEVNKDDLEVGDYITLTVKLKSDTKLYALLATLSYDQNIFEAIDERDFKNVAGWSDVIYNAQNNKFGLINKSGEILDTLLKVELRVKDKASVGKTNITLSNISASDGNKKISFEDQSISVMITKDAKDNEQIPSNNIEEEIKNESILKSFSNRPIIMILLSVVIILLITLIIINILKLNNKKKVSIILSSIIGICLIGLLVLLFINSAKKDVNNDGKNDYEDAKDIIKYLIDIEGTQESKPNNNKYDTNNDGQVDINDAGSITDNVTNETSYKVKLTQDNYNYYVNKNQEITLEFNAQVNPQATIKKVVIDNKTYDVIKSNNSYQVILKSSNKAGLQEYKFSQVILDNNRKIDLNFKFKIEVLKDKPQITDFNIDNKTGKISFNLEDQDQAWLNGYLIIKDKNQNQVLKKDLTSSLNEFSYQFNQDEIYYLTIIGSYDLDSNIKANNAYYDQLFMEKEVFLTTEYNFSISDVLITKEITKNEAPIISFISKNSSNYPIEYVIINGTNYPVTTLEEENNYQIILPIDSKVGSKNINIEAIVLSNGKSFLNNVDYTLTPLTYTILKDKPTIELSLTDDDPNKLIKGEISTTDKDNTITKLWATLTDADNKVLSTVEIKDNKFAFSYQDSNHVKFNVNIYANYDLGTKDSVYEDIQVATNTITVKSNIYISASSVSKTYPQKNEVMYVKYEVTVPKDYGKKVGNLITSITINGLNYPTTRNTASDDKATYTISFKAPNKAGLTDLVASRVMFADGTYVYVKDNILTIDVLKDKPQITDFKVINEDYNKYEATISFNIDEENNTLEQVKLVYDNFEHPVYPGKNTITIKDLTPDKIANLKIYADYDLDSNTIITDKNQNYYSNQEIFNMEYSLINPKLYQDLKITNLKAISKNNNHYFTKDEPIKLEFNFTWENDLNISLASLIIDNKTYNVVKDNDKYYILLDGLKDDQIKEIKISSLVLSNGKVINLDNIGTNIEILKTKLSINDLKYELSGDNINIYLNFTDLDNTLVNNISLDIKTDNSSITHKYTFNNNVLTIKSIAGAMRYYLKVIASYDLDNNKYDNLNNYPNEVIYEDVISLDAKYLELKEITDTVLYHNINGISNIVTSTSKEELDNNLNEYFVKISSSVMPDIYSKIKEVLIENNHLILVLDYEYTISKENNKVANLRVDFGEIKENVATNTNRPQNFIDLINAIKNDPQGSFVLEHDYDAKDIEVDTTSLIDIDFAGTLDGKGYTIKNLTKSLFNNLNKATITNLNFENVILENGSHGILGNIATDSKISKILVTGIEKNGTESSTGAIIGGIKNSTLDQVKVTGLILNNGTYDTNVGGIVGYANNNSIISNSYVLGTITSGYQHIGGIVGSTDKTSTVKNCFTKANINNAFGYAGYINTGSIVGSSNGILINNIGLASGQYGYKIAQIYNSNDQSKNNYQLLESNYTSNVGDAFIDISKDNINSSFFKNKALFDDAIWNLEEVSYNNLPTLKIENFKLPNSNNLKDNELYNKDLEILYQNLYLLMPFYENETILREATKINSNDILNKEVIKHIIPLTKEGNLVTYLTTKDYRKIKTIKVIFANNTVKTYDITFDKLYDMVAAYQINDLNISYTYNHYILDEDSSLITNLVNYLSNLDYTNDLDSLTTISDSRLYRDHYNEVTKLELKDFVLKYLANSNYTVTNNNETINSYLEKELISNNTLKKVLYVYNYFHRWYDVNINGIKLYDLILFNSNGFNKMLNIDDITNMFMQNETNFATSETNNVYNKTLAKYTDIKDVTMLIEYYLKYLSNTNPDTWFKEEFKGYLTEIAIDNRSDLTYSAWSHIKAVWQNYALVILTLPERSTYIISSPTQYLIGSIRTYIADPFNPVEYQKFQEQVAEYASKIKTYYTTASKIIEDSIYFNNIHNVQIDHRFTKDENGNSVYQSPYVTEEGFHKNFQEPLNQWQDMNGTAAGANGSQVKYNAYSALTAYGTWSHESAHNQDARLFLKNNGRRWDAGGEDYADGNLSQRWTDGEINMNLSLSFKETDNMSANLVPERIDSPAKIKDFYSKLFDTYYILDYLEAKAYLQLSKEDQAMITFQVSYPDIDNKDQKLKYKKTKYSQLSLTEFNKLKLEDIEDLYDNKLVLYPGMPESGTWFGDNKYGAEKIYKTRWYHPHNDYGRPDSYSLKIFAYEMLGYAGYDEGYIAYYSNINPNADGSKTDLDALRAITKNPNITFKDYRMTRFKYVEDNLKYIQYIDVNQVVEDFYYALIKDAEAVRIAKETGDTNKINNALNLVNSTDVKRQAYYTIKRSTNDFVGKVYDNSIPHNIKDFTIKKES